MTDQTLDWLQEQPAATLILAAYAAREAQLPKRAPRRTEAAETPAEPVSESGPPPESVPAPDVEAGANDEENADAWVARISSVDGVETSILSQLHGGLIARGYLKYELFGRQLGLRYRLTPEGRRAAETAVPVSAEAIPAGAAA